MTDQPLFTPRAPDAAVQACERRECGTELKASDDELRVRGWLVYNGRSVTGKPLHVRICPTCQSETTPPRTAPHAEQPPLA